MKIALLTIHNVSNYGAVLQAFATKEILSQYGEVETINYFNPHLPDKPVLVRFDLSIRGIRWIMHDILRLRSRSKLLGKFQKFIEVNMNLSKLLTQHDIRSGLIDPFDVYVCGSDQIWNPSIVSKDGKLDPIYFLNFANKKAKKVSYASSMGNYRFENSERAKEEINDLLREFVTISVRESHAQKVLSQLLKREVFHVLDPTLLLSKGEWLEALKMDKNYKSQKEDYILVYLVWKDPLIKTVVEFFVRRLGKKVVGIDQAFKPFVKVDCHIRDAGPIEFIELFLNASFVVTNSFHGVCFSINFKKPFVLVYPVWGGNKIESLLNLFDLKDKLVNSEKDIYNLNIDLDREFLENKLKHERAKSIEVLSSSIVS